MRCFQFMILYFMGMSSGLLRSYQLVHDLSHRGGIDDSHNHVHSKEVLFWTGEIIRRLPFELTQKEIHMTGHCVLLHDMMDRKYFDYSDEVRTHLQTMYNEHDTNDMMRIMKDMSYSKIVGTCDVTNKRKISFPEWIHREDPEKRIETIFHIVREADLLSSYNLARMVEYRRNLFPKMSDDDIRKDVQTLFDKRMDTLIDDGLFFHPTTAHLAYSLVEVARMKIKTLPHLEIREKGDLSILRIIDCKNIPIETIIDGLLNS